MILPIFLFGVSAYLLWISWALHFPTTVLFGVATLLACFKLLKSGISLWKYSIPFFAVAVFMLMSHAVGLFLPEVGFDAVWYHLPITEVFARIHETIFIPELYQSAMPRLGSYLFAFPYITGGVFAVKLVTYMLGLLLLYQTYIFASRYLEKKLSIFVCLLFLSFHTIAWQMSSAYTDILRSLFEVTALLLLDKKSHRTGEIFLAGLFVGFALSTKLVALFFFPAFMFYVWLKHGWKSCLSFILGAFLTIAPWYIQSYQWTGNPIFPLFQSLTGQEQLLGEGFSSVSAWIGANLLRIPFLPVFMSVHSESLTTPLFFFAYPFLILSYKKMMKNEKLLLVFTLLFLIPWLLLPPVSVRYGLTGFIVMLILCIWAIWKKARTNRVIRYVFYGVCFFGILMNMTIRMGSHVSALSYLSGKESLKEYVAGYAIGISKGPLEKWYSGYWKTYPPKL